LRGHRRRHTAHPPGSGRPSHPWTPLAKSLVIQAGRRPRAKLVLNNWLADLTETTAETLSFARQLGLDPAAIVDLLESTPLASPYAMQKARTILAGDFTPAFPLKLALKDADLAASYATS
jgi:3-hydroxyisobutyrate dehydrogenase